MPTRDSKHYDKHRLDQAEKSRLRSAAGREIGEIPAIADVRRRARCRKSLRLFCETYLSESFYLGWSDDHLRAIERLQEAAIHGALYAYAMPRGSGKTTLARAAALWSLSYSLRRFVYVIGATAAKAADTLESIKTYIRFLPKYAADFPEISHPVIALQGIAQRAGGQTCGGDATQIEWSRDRVILATVPPPANWPKSWPLRADGKTPSSGGVIGVAGLTGDGIRGSLLTLTTGESVRPDLVLLDDPQTAESAASPAQNATRLQLVSADVLGMAGPGKSISAVMPCTVIRQGDMADEILDRSKHPLWRGERTRLMRSMPSDLGAWDRYFEIYRECAQAEPPDFDRANQYYLAHRLTLDAGADAAWADRKLPGEVSAVQHAMHLYYRDARAFAAEYQNAPLSDSDSALSRSIPAEIANSVNRVPHGVCPPESTRLTASIDCGQSVLWYTVAAWDERYGGSVIDYGAWPRQSRSYYTAADASPTVTSVSPGVPVDAAVYSALASLIDHLAGREYPIHGTAGHLRPASILVDSGWKTDVVTRCLRESPHAAILLASKGFSQGSTARPMQEWTRRPGERVSPAGCPPWRVTINQRSRLLIYDADGWKSFAADRLLTPGGVAGRLTLYGDRPAPHRLYADHLASERAEPVEVRGRRYEKWSAIVGHDNHLWDTLVGAAVAASVSGLLWSTAPAASAASPSPRPRLKPSEWQGRKNAGK